MCKESDAFGPIVHFPCHSDSDCQKSYGPACKRCINTFCCPPPTFDKIHIQASKE
ncbi:hypothetical protein Lalb_Chr21g0305921 [Lupinus albus]|uniref:Uncharacterized protein n=1 Tax=Lupinus albus TaxID=3870 RepID=A0A6A4NAX6_LUPAL|nr:hypothetical protein Lalb_Chr21g0305921 [Lupinus albus]